MPYSCSSWAYSTIYVCSRISAEILATKSGSWENKKMTYVPSSQSLELFIVLLNLKKMKIHSFSYFMFLHPNHCIPSWSGPSPQTPSPIPDPCLPCEDAHSAIPHPGTTRLCWVTSVFSHWGQTRQCLILLQSHCRRIPKLPHDPFMALHPFNKLCPLNIESGAWF